MEVSVKICRVAEHLNTLAPFRFRAFLRMRQGSALPANRTRPRAVQGMDHRAQLRGNHPGRSLLGQNQPCSHIRAGQSEAL